MRNFKVTIAYNGAAYHGWQRQNNAYTVQEAFENALFELIGERISVNVCSRTDAGVHAREYVLSFMTASTITCRGVVFGLNAILDDDIAVLACEEADESFHARYSCKGKEYEYIVHNSEIKNPFYKYTFTQGYSSLSKLLRIIQSKDMLKYSASLLEALNLPVNGKMTPTALINVLEPEQLVQENTKDGVKSKVALWTQSQKTENQGQGRRIKVFEADGVTPVLIDKTKVIKEGQWSFKLLCDLIAQKEFFANKRSKR